jgi:hypothetical protein
MFEPIKRAVGVVVLEERDQPAETPTICFGETSMYWTSFGGRPRHEVALDAGRDPLSPEILPFSSIACRPGERGWRRSPRRRAATRLSSVTLPFLTLR